MTVAGSIALFVSTLHGKVAVKTRKSYSDWLGKFVSAHGQQQTEDLKPSDVEEWLAGLRRKDGEPYAPDSIRAAIVSISQWAKYAKKSKHLKKRLLKNVHKPPGRKRDRIPTEAEQRAILAEASPALAQILGCLRLTGARPGELCGAMIEDYDREAGMIVLRQHKTAKKTGAKRKIGVGRHVRDIVVQAIGDRTSGPIFLNDHGRPWSAGTVSHAFHDARDRAGVTSEIVLYCLRHFAGTMICEKLGIHAAAHALGHTDVKTTQRYCHPRDEKLAEYQDRVFDDQSDPGHLPP